MRDLPLVNRLKARIHDCLRRDPAGGPATLLIRRLLITLVVVNIVAFVLQTVPALDTRYGAAFGVLLLLRYKKT